MPHFVVDKVAEALNTQRKAVNGSHGARRSASPTSATSTTSASRRRSTSWAAPRRRGAQVAYTDPYVPHAARRARGPATAISTSVPLTPDDARGVDCVVILTDHTAFDYEAIVDGAD